MGDETKSQTHQVQSGDTLSAIARRNGTTVSALSKANGISNPNQIQAGQTLVVPAGGQPPAAPPAAPAAAAQGQKAAETKSDKPPGAVVKSCPLKKQFDKKVRAGGDDNVDALYAEAGGSAHNGVAEGKVGVGMVRMSHAGNFGDSIFGGSHQLDAYTAEAKGYAGAQMTGIGGQGEASTRMVKENASVFIGEKNNPYAEAGVEYELMSAEAKGDFLLGSDGKRAGISLGGGLGAAAAKGDVSGEINIPIPFTDWTISLKGKGGGSAGSIGAGAKGYGYKNLESGRYHAGVGGEAAAVLGLKADVDLSIGPSYTSRDR